MSDEKKLSEQVRNCAYIVPDPHQTDTEAGEREVLGLNQVADEIAALEQRLEAAEAEKQRIVEMFIKEMCIVNPHSSVVCSRGIKGCVMQHTHLQAAEADQQRAIDAAFEHVAGLFDYVGKHDEAGFLRSWCGTNPLAEARARIAELETTAERANGLARFYVSDKEADAEKALIRQAQKIHEMRGEIADLTAQLAEARKDAERYGFLRGNVPEHSTRWPRWEVRYWTGQWWETLVKDDLNKAIDATMRQEGE